jgi:hypothetical protein
MTLRQALERMFARPEAQLPEWALTAKRSGRSLDLIAKEIRECRSVRIPQPAPAETRAQRFARARRLCANYPELSFETVARCIRLDYSEDAMNSLRLAAISERIAQRSEVRKAAPAPTPFVPSVGNEHVAAAEARISRWGLK